MLRAIASGLIGKAAGHGGNEIVALGLGLQWAMSILIAAVYDPCRQLPLPTRRVSGLPWGLIHYGVGVHAVMTYVVVPSSQAAKHSTPPPLMVQGETSPPCCCSVPDRGLSSPAGSHRRKA